MAQKTKWRQRIESAHRNRAYADAPTAVKFPPPATRREIAALENLFGVKVPAGLAELLSESDGVMDCMQIRGEWIEVGWLLWPASEIVRENTWLRGDEGYAAHKRRFDDLLFFAGAGVDGILFGISPAAGEAGRDNVYIWHPIDNAVKPLVPSFEEFIDEWIGGKLAV